MLQRVGGGVNAESQRGGDAGKYREGAFSPFASLLLGALALKTSQLLVARKKIFSSLPWTPRANNRLLRLQIRRPFQFKVFHGAK